MHRSSFILLLAIFCTTAGKAATFNVTTIADSGAGSLRQAIIDANNSPGDNTIAFLYASAGPFTIQLATALPDLNSNIAILNENEADSQIIVRRSTVAGTPNFRIFTIAPGVTVTIAGLTIAGGFLQSGTGIEYGGGILTTGAQLTLRNCIVTANTATTTSGSGEGGNGSAIYNDGRSGSAALTLINCTISNNSGNRRGTILNNGSGGGNATLSVSNCTINNNFTNVYGGHGIWNDGTSGAATAAIVNSTFSANSTTSGSSPACIVNLGASGNGSVSLFSCTIFGSGGGSLDNVCIEHANDVRVPDARKKNCLSEHFMNLVQLHPAALENLHRLTTEKPVLDAINFCERSFA